MIYSRTIFEGTPSEKNIKIIDYKNLLIDVDSYINSCSDEDFCKKIPSIKEMGVNIDVSCKINIGKYELDIKTEHIDNLGIDNDDYFKLLKDRNAKFNIDLGCILLTVNKESVKIYYSDNDYAFTEVVGNPKEILNCEFIDKVSSIYTSSGGDELMKVVDDYHKIFVNQEVLDLKDFCEKNGYTFFHHSIDSNYMFEPGIEVSPSQIYLADTDTLMKTGFMGVDSRIENHELCHLSDSERVEKILELCTYIRDYNEILIGAQAYQNGEKYISLVVPFYRDDYVLDIKNGETARHIKCADKEELKTVLENAYMYAQVDKDLVMKMSDEELKSPELNIDKGSAVEAEVDTKDKEDKIELE